MTPSKPERAIRLENLNGPELHNKKKDILLCLESPKQDKEKFKEQLRVINEIINKRKQLKIVLDSNNI